MKKFDTACLPPEADTHEQLSAALGNAMGWTDYSDRRNVMLRARVLGLGEHAIRQALHVIASNPEAELRQAAIALISKDDTDELSFLGVESWTHHSLKKTLRLVGAEKRYMYMDYLQAPAVILAEARNIVAMTNLLLAGELSHGSDNTQEVRGGWAISNSGLVALIQRHPYRGNEILETMKSCNTCDVSLIEDVLETTTPLVSGIL